MHGLSAGLDARAAAIVMRTVRNIVNTGRTIVCTIHQPSIDIFEAFDELLLLKRGGELIFNGQLGSKSKHLVRYFSVRPLQTFAQPRPDLIHPSADLEASSTRCYLTCEHRCRPHRLALCQRPEHILCTCSGQAARLLRCRKQLVQTCSGDINTS